MGNYACPVQHCYVVPDPRPLPALPDLRPAHARRSRADAFARNAGPPTRSKKAGSNKPPARVW